MLRHTDEDYKMEEVWLGHLKDCWICEAQPHLGTLTDTELLSQDSCDDPRKEVSNRGRGSTELCLTCGRRREACPPRTSSTSMTNGAGVPPDPGHARWEAGVARARLHRDLGLSTRVTRTAALS